MIILGDLDVRDYMPIKNQHRAGRTIPQCHQGLHPVQSLTFGTDIKPDLCIYFFIVPFEQNNGIAILWQIYCWNPLLPSKFHLVLGNVKYTTSMAMAMIATARKNKKPSRLQLCDRGESKMCHSCSSKTNSCKLQDIYIPPPLLRCQTASKLILESYKCASNRQCRRCLGIKSYLASSKSAAQPSTMRIRSASTLRFTSL